MSNFIWPFLGVGLLLLINGGNSFQDRFFLSVDRRQRHINRYALLVSTCYRPPASSMELKMISKEKRTISIEQGSPSQWDTAVPMVEENADSCSLLLSSSQEKLDYTLVLASQSPRRREILDMMGLEGQYLAIPSPLNESDLQDSLTKNEKNVNPIDYSRILAEHKAQAFGLAILHDGIDENLKLKQFLQQEQQSSGLTSQNYIVLGSDTIVDLDGHILEKPSNEDEARHMLSRLSGVWHKVHTGVALYGSSNSFDKPLKSFTTTTRVKFASLTDEDISSYISTGEPMDKAGSYGIQGIGGQMVECIEGDFFAVMGLPMHPLSTALASILRK